MIKTKYMSTLKRIAVLVFVLCFAFVLASCGASEPEPTPSKTPEPTPTPTPIPETSMTEIQDRGELVVACEAAHPPYIYVKRVGGDFEVLGPDIELAKAIADELGVTLVIKSVKIADIPIGIELGLYDIAISNITSNDKLFENVNFTNEYFKKEFPIIINKEFVDQYDDLKSFKDKRFGVIRKTPQAQLVKDQVWYPRMKYYTTETKMIDNLITNYLAAICMEPYRARFYLDKYPDLTYLGISLSGEESSGPAIAVAKGKEDFVEYINGLLIEFEEDNFLLKQQGISETDYDKNTLEIDSACSDYLGILYGK